MANGLEDAVGCVAIQGKTLDTGIGLRNRYMWEGHLEVAQFPEIRFILTDLADLRLDANMGVLTLEGELILHGVTQTLRIPATIASIESRACR